MQDYLNYLEYGVEDGEAFLMRILTTLALVFLMVGLNSLISKFIDRLANKERTVRIWTRISRLLGTTIVFMGIFYLWFSSLRGVGILFGAFIFVLLLSLQDILIDIIYYIYVVFRKPFKIGDVIQIGDYIGIVEDFDIIQVRIQEIGNLTDAMLPTGRIFTVSNRSLFEEKVFNFTRDTKFLIQDINILIDFDADRELALKLAGKFAYKKFQDLLERYDGEELKIFDREMEYIDTDKRPKVWAQLDANGFRIYVIYFSRYDELALNRRLFENGLYDIFEKNGISMPVPHYYRSES